MGVNARMGGGPTWEVNYGTWGVDLVEEVIFTGLGIPSRPMPPEKPIKCIAWNAMNARKSGKIKSVECIEALREKDGVWVANPLVNAGDEIVGEGDGLPSWLCMLIVTGSTSQESLKYALDLEAELPVEIN